MFLRKNRVHQQGATNIDYRAQTADSQPEVKTRLELLSTHKNNKFSEIVQQRISKICPNPIEETKTFYKDSSKQTKERQPIGIPRSSQLEEKQLRKRVFTGDSNLIYDERILSNYQFIKGQQLEVHNFKDHLIKEKHEIHSKATQETQLVSLEKTKMSLKGKVDLEKIKEIRRTLRRRYTNRKNFQKIFNQWDQDSQGVISLKNVIEMLNQLNIKINFDEARVLMATVDQDHSGDLSMDEFMDLIFNPNDNINVNLGEIYEITQEQFEKQYKQNQGLEFIKTDAKNYRDSQHYNQLQLILKNKFVRLGQMLRLADEGKQGFVPYERLEQILKKLNIPEQIMSTQDIKSLYDQHKIDDYKFDYRQFLQHLADYNFKPDDIYTDNQDYLKQKTSIQKVIEKYKVEDNQISIYEAQTINPCHMEQIRESYRKVKRVIQRYLGTQEDFQQLFLKHNKLENKEQLKDQQISKRDLTKFIQNIFLTVGEKDVKKREIENFLSIFNYNTHNHALMEDIAYCIYKQEDDEWYDKMQQRVNRPPPPFQCKFHEDFLPDNNNTDQKPSDKQQDKNTPNNDNLNKSSILNSQEVDAKRLINANYIVPKTAGCGFRKSASTLNVDQQLSKLLEKFENRVFVGSQRAYHIYQQFDVDKDGFVSQKDFVNKVREMAIFADNEIRPVLQYLDPQNKGYVNFREFCNKLRVGVNITDEIGNNTYVPFTQPSKLLIEEKKSLIPTVTMKFSELKDQYVPKYNLIKNTRFSASPAFQNTFMHFLPQKSSPMFITDKERFAQVQNHREQFQKEESKKQQQYCSAKIEKLKKFNETYSNKLQGQTECEDNRELAKLKSKGLAQWNYEHRAHLQNDWK